ncbi:MAG TPA: cobalamin-dependent protein [Candidatus Hydrogenedentes bacterium]|nr:cobalamin-dependent protein [Candidatus Hydrogenedentota bacterium]HQH52326.1 cobalamin-dependent protein [Candidatus Hydrogenedentota bacterium]HQM47428.1 cobalamin-dependent protein [Candidatus Hydrogenedentota bacterium]
MSEELLQQLAVCVERGKVNQASPYPPDMKGKDGADELAKKALEQGISPNDVLEKALIVGMGNIGKKFSANQVFVPDVLMAAKAMSAAMAHLKPFLDSGQVKTKGTFVIGTVQGDLHDIGKNLVCMVMEGGGWKVVDLGVDVSPEKFLAAVKENPGAAVGLSALLTTTMVNMEKTVKLVKDQVPGTTVVVGGAPLTQEFANKIGADAYSPDPQGALDYLNINVAA